MNRLPDFSMASYRTMLEALRESGYRSRLLTDKQTSGKNIYLRHDIDLFLEGWEEMPRLEQELRMQATYYIMLGQYNVFSPRNQTNIRELARTGHEIGLHYDPAGSPQDVSEARRRLEFEISVLENIAGQKIRTISPHNPFRFEGGVLDTSGFIDPSSQEYLRGMTYVSDSVRSWRDETLLECFGEHPPSQVVILIHPELWLDGAVKDRMTYIDRVLMPLGTRSLVDYFDKTVRQVWSEHPAPRLHDAREQNADGRRPEERMDVVGERKK